MVGRRLIEGLEALTIGSADGELEAAFVPGAGMICCSLTHRGEQLLGRRHGLRGYVEQRSTMGIPLLYPWANRLGAERFVIGGRTVDLSGVSARLKRDDDGLPIHGLLTAAPGWRVERHRVADGGAELAASFDWGADAALLDAFPFPHRLRIEAAIEPGVLRWRTTVQAEPGTPVPIAYGYHPYLTLPGLARESWLVELPLGEQLLLDGRGLPTGERRPPQPLDGPLGERSFDDLYAAPAAGVPLVLAGGGRRIELTIDDGYRYVQVYAPAGEQLIALEPMTAPTNALAEGAAPLCAAATEAAAGFSISVR